MAILCLSRDYADLKERLGRILRLWPAEDATTRIGRNFIDRTVPGLPRNGPPADTASTYTPCSPASPRKA
jgi:hypothetical protein